MAHTSCLIHWQRCSIRRINGPSSQVNGCSPESRGHCSQRCRNRLKSLIRRSIHCRGTLPTVIVAAALMVTVDITLRGTKGE